MITWDTVWQLIVSTSIIGTVLTALGAVITLVLKKWIINFFKKDLIRFEKNIKQELKETELKLSKLVSLEENYYKSLLESYKRIWKKLNSLSRYLSSEFTAGIQYGKYTNKEELLNPIRNYVFDIKDDTIFLSTKLDTEISKLLDSFLINDLNEIIAYLGEVSKNDSKGDKELEVLNKKINAMQLNFAKNKHEIKELIQKDYTELMNK